MDPAASRSALQRAAYFFFAGAFFFAGSFAVFGAPRFAVFVFGLAAVFFAFAMRVTSGGAV